MTGKWTTADMPSLAGRVAIVTGANRGLGLEITTALAVAGASIVMACRDRDRARTAATTVLRNAPRAQVDILALDLADQASIRPFANAYARQHASLDLLIHNASAIMVPQQKTRDGFEMHFGVNHLGAFALTGLLLDALKASATGARVVSMSSLSHRMTGGLQLDDVNLDRTPYKVMDAYGRSKLAALMFGRELDRRLRRAGLPIRSVIAHPGYAATNLGLGGFFMRLMTRVIAQPPAMGALPALYAATAPDAQGGDFYGPAGMNELRGHPKKVEGSLMSRDETLARQLWEVSEKLTGVSYLDG